MDICTPFPGISNSFESPKTLTSSSSKLNLLVSGIPILLSRRYYLKEKISSPIGIPTPSLSLTISKDS
jgi:hypothetical protein